MQEEVRVVLDAMGGDHAPEEMIKGAVEAVNEKNNIHVLLVGQEDVISEELEKYTYPKERMEIVHASDRDSRAASHGDPQEKGFLHCGRNEYGKKR